MTQHAGHPKSCMAPYLVFPSRILNSPARYSAINGGSDNGFENDLANLPVRAYHFSGSTTDSNPRSVPTAGDRSARPSSTGPFHQRFSRFSPSENSGFDFPPLPLKRYLWTHASIFPSAAHFWAEQVSSSNRLISCSRLNSFDGIDFPLRIRRSRLHSHHFATGVRRGAFFLSAFTHSAT
jgi:hypothetical protein